MPEGCEGVQVAARPAAEVEDDMGRRALDGVEQGRDVLAHVVVRRAVTVGFRHAVVFGERDGGGLVRCRVFVAQARTHRAPSAPRWLQRRVCARLGIREAA